MPKHPLACFVRGVVSSGCGNGETRNHERDVGLSPSGVDTVRADMVAEATTDVGWLYDMHEVVALTESEQ